MLCSIHCVDQLITNGTRSANFDAEDDWNIITEPNPHAANRAIKVSRDRYLGGQVVATDHFVCIRGIKQDCDDWEVKWRDSLQLYEKGMTNAITEGIGTNFDRARTFVETHSSKRARNSMGIMGFWILSLMMR